MGPDLDPLDRALLDRVQAGVPLTRRPFAAVAAGLGQDEADIVSRLVHLQVSGVLRQIGGIFDTRACGYASALVAARVPVARVEAAAAVVGRHPGVTHCYERAHAWNLWFTLAVPPSSSLGLDGTIARLREAAGVETMHALPALRTYKIAARFAMSDDAPPPRLDGGARPAPDPAAVRLTGDEVAAIRALQRPLPLCAAPFAAAASAAGLGEGALLSLGQALLERGRMRRFAALLDHRRAGLAANVMAAWAVPGDRVDDAGACIAALSAVTHCYARATFDGWPYTLFSMIHGKTREACLALAGTIREAIAPTAEALLWTVKEFKKTRLQLFTPDVARWEST